MAPFFLDEPNCQNDVLFGMKLTENIIPVHRLEQSIEGLGIENTNEARTS